MKTLYLILILILIMGCEKEPIIQCYICKTEIYNITDDTELLVKTLTTEICETEEIMHKKEERANHTVDSYSSPPLGINDSIKAKFVTKCVLKHETKY